MSQKQGPDLHSTCVDGVRVKISEKYKPPPKINLAITYSQRISMNKHIQDNMSMYEFTLETSIKSNMSEWRTAREQINKSRKEKLDRLKDEHRKRQLKLQEESELNKTNLVSKHSSYTTAGVLIPTQVNNTLSNDKNTKIVSPINISDFESDNSSPFDNVELKTINDMEELKLVLQNDSSEGTNQYPSQTYYGYNVAHSSNQTYNSYANGYNYYTSETLHPTYYSNQAKTEYSSSFEVPAIKRVEEDDKIPFRSVPDIMTALQTELNNTHLHNRAGNSSDASKLEIDNTYEQLPMKLQDVCRIISSMGFPLARVAKVCKEIGDDQKKIVEHLLAMSELLDLGFSESKVLSALLKCDNDRDKALELLIM